mmetsp:Transcript_29734/g.49069  ORF Transcript_29734/g.49069 Transcript_29734/m.49069 type:complete len:96 (+) Transcript_29734:1872-2159(+)
MNPGSRQHQEISLQRQQWYEESTGRCGVYRHSSYRVFQGLRRKNVGEVHWNDFQRRYCPISQHDVTNSNMTTTPPASKQQWKQWWIFRLLRRNRS